VPTDHPGVADLGYARLDTDRMGRTGDPESVYGAGKTAEQIAAILDRLHRAHPERAILATRTPPGVIDGIAARLPADRLPLLVRDDEAEAVILGTPPQPVGSVGVISAGTSDARVAAEAALTVRAHGSAAERITDVGVAGLHRIMSTRERLAEFDCLIVVAGMEGALPSVVGGLTGVPLVAVPTSVGYGASFGGLAALLGMLNSCAPGVVVVNIDNGYGAGVHAARIARRSRPR
jgi:hypothetical protein